MTQQTIREPQQIQQEYAALCAQSGEKTYQITVLQKDLRRINARINALNREMSEALKRAEEAKQAAPIAVEEKKDDAAVAQ